MSYSSIGFHKQQKDTILPASKFVEVPQEKETETDWSKVPFPEKYVISNDTEIIVISDSHKIIKPGTKGKTVETSLLPNCYFEEIDKYYCLHSYELAPLNPTDHPNHP
jgi:hypothetical protein